MNTEKIIANYFRSHGTSKNKPDNRYNKKELILGIKSEMEHTGYKSVAKEIAKDHLEEIPNYYSMLLRMEKRAKKR